MARRFILSDDLTQQESEDVKNHVVMVDNVFYEVDFSADSFGKFEAAMAPFMKVMRETRRITATAKGEASKAEVIRQWAKANGFEVSERGRMAEEIISAYDAAHSDDAPTDAQDDAQNGTQESTEGDSEEAKKGTVKAAK